MASFEYSAYTSAGKRVEGQIEADNVARAADALSQKGMTPNRIVERTSARSEPAQKSSRKGPRLSGRDFASFARQLATLLSAELPLDRCLKLVATQSARTRIGPMAARLAASVITGRSLSETIASEVPEAPRFMAPLIRAGEARGTLTPCLGDLARILERRVEIANRFRSALVYPAILLTVALLTVGLVVTVLVPSMMPLFQDTGTAPPFILQSVDTVSRFVTANWQAVLVLALIFSSLATWGFRQHAVKLAIDRWLTRLPGIGTLIVRTNVAMIARTMATLLRNGVPLVTALGLSSSVATSPQFKDALENAAEAVRGGSKLGKALQATGLFPELAMQFVSIGEESSRLDELLFHLADLSDQENQRQIDQFMTLMTPVITLLVGVMIGGLILSVMQAIFSVNEIAIK